MTRRTTGVLVVLALVVGLAGWLATTGNTDRCAISAKLVPSCGALLGVATNPNTADKLRVVEKNSGRPFDLVYRFHDLNDSFPTADERSLVAQGRILHISIDARIYGSPDRAVTWSDVSSGEFDDSLNAQARGVAALAAPVFMTFDHEPDQPKRVALGSPADFVAAWRHVHDLFVRDGARNTVWVWVVTGYLPTAPIAGRMWPGNDYVDWISWEAYNGSGCAQSRTSPSRFESFGESVLPFYDWLTKHAATYRIDIGKPMMISEAGSVVYNADPGLTASWYRQIPAVLAAHRNIRAIALWDRPGNAACDYQFDTLPAVRSAVAALSVIMKYPWLAQGWY